MTPEDVLESLVEECHEDHVGLWEIVNAVRFDLGSVNPMEIRAMTLELVRSLLHDRDMQVGHPAPDGRHFVSWNLPPDQAVRRIEKEWSALGREPNSKSRRTSRCWSRPSRHNVFPPSGQVSSIREAGNSKAAQPVAVSSDSNK